MRDREMSGTKSGLSLRSMMCENAPVRALVLVSWLVQPCTMITGTQVPPLADLLTIGPPVGVVSDARMGASWTVSCPSPSAWEPHCAPQRVGAAGHPETPQQSRVEALC